MGGDGLPGPTDAWVTLAALARETTRIRLGTLVSSATFRWPGVLAITVAQVDAMSGGRIELGLGTGWYDGEHTAYGIPFPALGERFERLEEQLAILTGLWATPVGEKFSFSGTHYTLADSPALPKPFQQPHPPLILGGAGAQRTPRLAATYADEFNVPFHGVADTQAQFTRVREACVRRDRDPASLTLSAAQVVCCGADEAEVARPGPGYRPGGRRATGQWRRGHARRGGGPPARAGGGGGGHRLSPGARPRRSRSPPAPQRARAPEPRVTARRLSGRARGPVAGSSRARRSPGTWWARARSGPPCHRRPRHSAASSGRTDR